MAAAEQAGAADADGAEPFTFEQYADMPDGERAQSVADGLGRQWPPATPLSVIVEGLRDLGAECRHPDRDVLYRYEFGGSTEPENLEKYECEHRRKLGGLKTQTTEISVFFDAGTCAVAGFLVETGTEFGFSVGGSMALRDDPAAHCFERTDE